MRSDPAAPAASTGQKNAPPTQVTAEAIHIAASLSAAPRLGAFSGFSAAGIRGSLRTSPESSGKLIASIFSSCASSAASRDSVEPSVSVKFKKNAGPPEFSIRHHGQSSDADE